MSGDEDVTPQAFVTTTVGGRVIGEFRAPLADPFARTRVTLSRWELLRGLREGGLEVVVHIDADKEGLRRWFWPTSPVGV